MDAEEPVELSKETYELLKIIGGCVECGEPPIISLLIVTSGGVGFLPFCLQHMTKASAALDNLVAQTISGAAKVQSYRPPQG